VQRRAELVVAVLLSVLPLAGCDTLVRSPEPGIRAAGSERSGRATTAGVGREDAGPLAPWEDPASPIYRRVVYFHYDRSDILPESVPLLRAHADYLSRHPMTQVTIEGHTDERGTREYNLALGDQRAMAVQNFLVAEGVTERQLDTLSYGEEKPASAGHSAAYWSQNRRAELVYQGP